MGSSPYMEKHPFMQMPYHGDLRRLRYILPTIKFPWRSAGAEHDSIFIYFPLSLLHGTARLRDPFDILISCIHIPLYFCCSLVLLLLF